MMSLVRSVKLRSGALFRMWLLSVVSLITIGAVSLIIGLSGSSRNWYALIIAAITFLTAGWLLLRRTGAVPEGYRDNLPPAGEALARKLGAALEIEYLPNWLQATILNPLALNEYWHCDRLLAIEDLVCKTEVRDLDARNYIRFSGKNESGKFAISCPMIMFGGSVIHYASLPENSAVLKSGKQVDVVAHCRLRLDTGQLHLIDMLFPEPLRPGAAFELEQSHVWTSGMTRGKDTLWYPYATLFEKLSSRLVIDAVFDRPLNNILGLEARLDKPYCQVAYIQPVDVDGTRTRFRWHLEPVDNDVIYGLVFERDSIPQALITEG